MKKNFLFLRVGIAAISLVALAAGCTLDLQLPKESLETGLEQLHERLRGEDESAREAEKAREKTRASDDQVSPGERPGVDTSLSDLVCEGEYLTRDQCLAVDGRIDDGDHDATICHEDGRLYCCLPAALINPCPGACAATYECVGWQDDPKNTGGAVLSNYDCPHYFDTCCVPSSIPKEPLTGEHIADQGCPIGEDVFQATLAKQPNHTAAMVCMEHLYLQQGEDAPWFCPQKMYERIVADLEILGTSYPMLEEHGWQMYEESGELLMCSAGSDCYDFPRDHFDDLQKCFPGITVDCLFSVDEGETCGISFLWFDIPFNVWRAVPYFDKHAQVASTDSVCEPDDIFWSTGAVGVEVNRQLGGYHLMEVNEEAGFFGYIMRASAEPLGLGQSACDLIIEVWVGADGTVYETSRQDLGDGTCSLSVFAQ